MLKLKKCLTMGIIFTIISLIVIYFTATQVDLGLYSPDDMNISPRAFPYFAGVLLGIFGICNILRSVVFKKDEWVVINLKAEAKVLLTFVGMMVYLLVFKWIGFIFSTTLLGWFMLFMQKTKNWKYYLIVAIATIVVFVGFKYGLDVRKLPWGYPLIWIFG